MALSSWLFLACCCLGSNTALAKPLRLPALAYHWAILRGHADSVEQCGANDPGCKIMPLVVRRHAITATQNTNAPIEESTWRTARRCDTLHFVAGTHWRSCCLPANKRLGPFCKLANLRSYPVSHTRLSTVALGSGGATPATISLRAGIKQPSAYTLSGERTSVSDTPVSVATLEPP